MLFWSQSEALEFSTTFSNPSLWIWKLKVIVSFSPDGESMIFVLIFFNLQEMLGVDQSLAMWFHPVNPTHRDKQIQPQQHQNLPISLKSWQCQWGEKSEGLLSGKTPKIVLKAPMMGIELFHILIAFFFLTKILKLLWPLDFFSY